MLSTASALGPASGLGIVGQGDILLQHIPAPITVCFQLTVSLRRCRRRPIPRGTNIPSITAWRNGIVP